MLEELFSKYKNKENDRKVVNNIKNPLELYQSSKYKSSNIKDTSNFNKNRSNSSNNVNDFSLQALFNENSKEANNSLMHDAKASKNVNVKSLEGKLASNSEKTNNKNKNKKDESQLDEAKFEEEFSNIIQKSNEIMNKYCTLYNEGTNNNNIISNITLKSDSTNNYNPKYNIEPLNSEYIKKKQNKINHTKTTGKDWFNMQAPEITPEIENDLKALQLRHIINPRRFYKRPDIDGLPRFFQIGTLQNSITQGKKYQLKRSEKKSSLIEEFIDEDADANYTTRKFLEIQTKKSKLGRKRSKINEYKLKNKSRGKKNSGYIAK